MKTHNEKYLNMVDWLNKLYDFINDKFFANALSKPVITVAPDDKRKAAGWFGCGKVWKDSPEDVGEVELNICATSLDRPVEKTAATMLHEMCHQYAHANNIQDCSRSGTYHNKRFAAIAEKFGLSVTKAPTIGYAVTELTTDSLYKLDYFLENVKLIYRLPLSKGMKVRNSSTRKYVCPECGQSVRATKEVNISCVDCDKVMICENDDE